MAKTVLEKKEKQERGFEDGSIPENYPLSSESFSRKAENPLAPQEPGIRGMNPGLPHKYFRYKAESFRAYLNIAYEIFVLQPK